MRLSAFSGFVFALALISASNASASTITFATPTGSELADLPVSASATFVTSLGQLTITIQNLIVDPTSVIQNISGLGFDISPEAGATIASQTGTLRTIHKDDKQTAADEGGTYTDLLGQTLGWTLETSSGNLFLNWNAGGPSGPDQTIIGQPGANNEYNNANGSIAGNGSHNPFVSAFSAIFVLNIPGVTAETLVNGATFRFGTEAALNFTELDCVEDCGEEPPPPGDVPVPEPATMVMLGTGLIGVAAAVRKRTRR